MHVMNVQLFTEFSEATLTQFFEDVSVAFEQRPTQRLVRFGGVLLKHSAGDLRSYVVFRTATGIAAHTRNPGGNLVRPQ